MIAMQRTLNSHDRGFTLIELLVVMAIIALIVGISVTSMHSPRGLGPLNGATELSHTLQVAREQALANRSRTMVVFAPNSDAGLGINSRLSYTILQLTAAVDRTDTATFPEDFSDPQDGWIYTEKWKKLPAGAFFIAPQTVPLQSMPFPTNGPNVDDLPCIKFNANGALVVPVAAGEFYDINAQYFVIREGTISETGVVLSSNLFNTISGAVYRNGRVKVFK
jgi:prepilin-type N-terminal cleavage/methylation domain-containing protein